MTLEHVGTVEALLRCTTAPGTETAYHRSLVVSESVPVFVVLSCKALGIVFARRDWTFLRTFVLVCKQVCLEIFYLSTAGSDRADTLVLLRIKRRVAVARFV